MSMGYGGYADLEQSDTKFVNYSYCCYHLEADVHFPKQNDGKLKIARTAFVEPELHEKVRRTASGRKKKVVKRVLNDIPLEELISSEKISIVNAGGTWKTTETGIDRIAIQIVRIILISYQKTGEIPTHVGLHY